MLRKNDRVLLILVASLSIWQSEVVTVRGENVSFNLPGEAPFDCSGNIICQGSASSANESLVFGSVPSAGNETTRGSALFHESVQMHNATAQTFVSFSLAFAFEVKPKAESAVPYADERLTFLAIANNSSLDTVLGTAQGTGKMFAVSFRTAFSSNLECSSAYRRFRSFPSPPNYRCVSSPSSNAQSLNETDSYSVIIDYNGTDNRLRTTITRKGFENTTSELEWEKDLAEHMAERMWIGFYAVSGVQVESYTVTDWSFSSYGLSEGSDVSSVTKKADSSAASSESDSGLSTPVIVGLSAGLPLLAALCAALLVVGYRFYHRRLNTPTDNRVHVIDVPDSSQTQILPVSANEVYSDISRLTDSRFSSWQPPKVGR